MYLHVDLIIFDFGVSIKPRSIIIHILIHVKYSESNGTMRKISFYMSFASRLACATCANRCARSVFCAPCAPFLALCAVWEVGVTPACESAIGGMSDANPGIRMLWLRSRWSCKSLTSSVSPLRCFASLHPKFVTESMNSSAISKRRSSTSGSILTFGSMLRTKSWIDRRMLASPGVDLRREDPPSSVSQVSSLVFFNADGVPAMRPAVKPPVSDGLPAAAVGQATGPGLVGFNVALIGYVSLDMAFSANMGADDDDVELPLAVVLSADKPGWGRGLGVVCFVVAGLCLSA